MKTLSSILTTGLVIVLTSSSLFAQMNPERRQAMQERRQAMMENNAEYGPQRGPNTDGPRIPGLTDEQRESINKLRVAHQKDLLPLRNQLGEHQAKMRTLTTAEKPDTKAINTLIDTMSKLQADMRKKQVAHRLAIRSTLTEEQRVWFDTHQGRRGQHGHYGKRGNKGDGFGQGRPGKNWN